MELIRPEDFKLFGISLVKHGGIPIRKESIRGMAKIACHYDDDASFQKSANGDMIAYFRDNPDKLKEKLERDKKKKMQKMASLPDKESLLERMYKRRGEKVVDGKVVLDKTANYRKRIMEFYANPNNIKKAFDNYNRSGLKKIARVDSADKNPTEAQKKAGNYKKGHIQYDGMDITIENPAGSYRSGVSRDGVAWKNKINHHYGYIKRTLGHDGDHVDVFINPGTKSTKMVYVINQVYPGSNKFDEHKCMLGFDSIEEAKKAYMSNYDKGWKGLKSIAPMSVENFKDWVYQGKKSEMAKKDIVKKAYLYAYNDELLKLTI